MFAIKINILWIRRRMLLITSSQAHWLFFCVLSIVLSTSAQFFSILGLNFVLPLTTPQSPDIKWLEKALNIFGVELKISTALSL